MFENYGISVIVYESLLTVFVISNFGLATFMDPGIYPQGLLMCLFTCQTDMHDSNAVQDNRHMCSCHCS